MTDFFMLIALFFIALELDSISCGVRNAGKEHARKINLELSKIRKTLEERDKDDAESP